MECWTDVQLGQFWPRVNSVQQGGVAWYLPIQIKQRTVHLLVDSGAQVSLINKVIFDQISAGTMWNIRPVEERVSAANGNAITLHGRVNIPFFLEKFQYQCKFLIADMGGLPGVLGMDFLTKYEATLHCTTGILQLAMHHLKCMPYNPVNGGRANVVHDQWLRPRHVSLVTIQLQGKCTQGNASVLLEPLMSVCALEHICIPRGIVSTKEPRMDIQVMNPGRDPILLPRGLLLASLESVEILDDGNDKPSKRVGATIAESTRELPEHLQQLVDEATSLTAHQSDLLTEALLQFEHCFEGGKYGLGRTTLTTHDIDTQNNKPIKVPARRLGWAQRRALTEEVDKMLKLGVIEPSSSPWSSPPVLVKKKDNTFRFCVDYRKLNSVSKKDSFPLPRIDDCLDALAGPNGFVISICLLDIGRLA